MRHRQHSKLVNIDRNTLIAYKQCIGKKIQKNSSEVQHLIHFSLPASTPPINRQAISTLMLHSYVLELLLGATDAALENTENLY